MLKALLLVLCPAIFLPLYISAQVVPEVTGSLKVMLTTDFSINGTGVDTAWNKAEWIELCARDFDREDKYTSDGSPVSISTAPYQTRFKILYSKNGIYCLFECEDSIVTATIKSDFGELYKEDVVEVFLWPDTTFTSYFEYELSPLNFELPLLIINRSGKAMGWKPWKYEDVRKVIHDVHVNRQQHNTMGRFRWSAEFFIPFKLLTPLVTESPLPGAKWRANFYRIDYDRDPQYFSWKKTRKNFHDFERFGWIEFD